MAVSGMLAVTAAGAAVGAMGTIAGGRSAAAMGQYQQQAANVQASALRDQAGSEWGIAQQKGLLDRYKTDEAISTGRARMAGGGTDPSGTSNLAVTGALKQRGELEALQDMWTGENRSVQLRNEANAVQYGGVMSNFAGQTQQSASRLSALQTILGGAGSMFKTYGALSYPSASGRAGLAGV